MTDAPSQWWRQAVRNAATALFLILTCVLTSPPSPAHAAERSIAHHDAPRFSRLDLNRKRIRLTDYRGKVVLLNFWATWCGPCLTEMPSFSDWQRKYGAQRFQAIGVSMDDAPAAVIATVTKLKLNYPIVMGDAHLGSAYGGILGLPVTFLIGTDGTIRARYEGAADLPRIRREIDSLLKTP